MPKDKSGKKPYFPLFIDLKDKRVLVVGAGEIAVRRVKTLVSFADRLTVIAPDALNSDSLLEMRDEGKVELLNRKYSRCDLYGKDIVFACTNDRSVNNDIFAVCKTLGILVNNASEKNECDFYFPGIALNGSLVAGITDSGQNHALVKKASERIRRLFETLV